jgi:hypothetical protein
MATDADKTKPPPSEAEKQLAKLTKELLDFDARKLPEVTKELDAFVKKQSAAYDDYAKEYTNLRNAWRMMQGLMEQSLAQIDQLFPEAEWKAIIAECVCVPRRDLECLAEVIDTRRRCAQGKKERAWLDAKLAEQDAKALQEALAANVANLKAVLKKNEGTHKDITATLNGKDKALALYPFFFELVPSHVAIAPDDCATFKDLLPSVLCDDAAADPCPDDDLPCPPPSGSTTGEKSSYTVPAGRPRSAPWLIHPDRYIAELDSAWKYYHSAKDALTQAERAYQADPDDLVAREKQLGEARKKAEQTRAKCLTAHTPADPCTESPKPALRED